jgi:5-methylcytosine-specific restriction protein B
MIGCNVEELDSREHFEFVQFHPSYDYTDFVEGLRPFKEQGNNNVHFELQYGTFKACCEKAAEFEDCFKEKPDKHKYVFVIDEINRGEISKIFGELFFSIDPGYRKKEDRIPVKTQYQNLIQQSQAYMKSKFQAGFYVPENVYIIGTMNDIDRSVESMDFAFRRRFAFKEVKAMDTADVILSQLSKDEDKAYKKLVAINDKHTELGLSDSYHIGAAYFRKLDLYNGNGKWNSLWDYHLYGTLYEYFRGEPDVDKKMKQLSDAYNNAEENN